MSYDDAAGDLMAVESLKCAPWCTVGDHTREKFRADQNCWGPDHPVVLGLDDNAPAAHLSIEEQLEQDPARITPCAYKAWRGLPVVYLHVYRPHETEHMDLDASVKLTPGEAGELASALMAVVAEIGGAK
ncbi:DUF6907 domain-containing protein [Mycolicibacterium brisbanense]|uniref:Uncharacterized protein n=1 Tax=Mycolicibacterium brisbanense TaxID=146020 RepID=A0A117I4V7_9MYCO|nr:hypothetical protein [Mycolicibacterium brisbanense]MCV7159368.1 hypothetical protein [Mycolicibacterium brisbanense]GAS87545.1 uncharacterized protein RMCB_1641 [Mycolicibacterium brisbanense]